MTNKEYTLLNLNLDYQMKFINLYCSKYIYFIRLIQGLTTNISNDVHDKIVKELLKKYSPSYLIDTFEFYTPVLNKPIDINNKKELDLYLYLFNHTDVGKSLLEIYNICIN